VVAALVQDQQGSRKCGAAPSHDLDN
jgi:hypothetical protein